MPMRVGASYDAGPGLQFIVQEEVARKASRHDPAPPLQACRHPQTASVTPAPLLQPLLAPPRVLTPLVGLLRVLTPPVMNRFC